MERRQCWVMRDYDLVVVGRRKRKEETLRVRDLFPALVRCVSSDDAPVAIRVLDSERGYVRAEYRWYDGFLLEQMVGEPGTALSAETFEQWAQHGRGGLRWFENPFDPSSVCFDAVPRSEVSDIREIKEDFQRRAALEVQAAADGVLFIDGAAWRRTKEPVWKVEWFRSSEFVTIARSYVDEESDRSASYFPIDAVDDVERHLKVLNPSTRVFIGDGGRSVGWLERAEILIPEAVGFNPADPFGDWLFDGFPARIARDTSAGFPLLPPPALRAWVDLRELSERWRGGDRSVLEEGVESLRSFLGALPDEIAAVNSRQVTDYLARLRQESEAILNRWEVDIARAYQVPVFGDEAALGAFGPTP